MVEFALMLPIFVLVALGTIDTGFVLNDTTKLRQVTREAARLGAVDAYGTNSSCLLTGPIAIDSTPEGLETKRLMCRLKVYAADVGLELRAAIRVVQVDDPLVGYGEGNLLLVCTEFATSSRSGMLRAVYQGRILHTKVAMRIADVGVTIGPAPDAYELPYDVPTGASNAAIATRWNSFCNDTGGSS